MSRALSNLEARRKAIGRRTQALERTIPRLVGSKAAWEAQQAVASVARTLNEAEQASQLLRDACMELRPATKAEAGRAVASDDPSGSGSSSAAASEPNSLAEAASGLRIGRALPLLEDDQAAEQLKELLAQLKAPTSMSNPPIGSPGSRFAHLHNAPNPTGMTPEKLAAGICRLLRPLILPQIRLGSLLPSELVSKYAAIEA
jgi:hypothetical protein